jgi:hypothetical protein
MPTARFELLASVLIVHKIKKKRASRSQQTADFLEYPLVLAVVLEVSKGVSHDKHHIEDGVCQSQFAGIAPTEIYGAAFFCCIFEANSQKYLRVVHYGDIPVTPFI